jgi:hypothetical protein
VSTAITVINGDDSTQLVAKIFTVINGDDSTQLVAKIFSANITNVMAAMVANMEGERLTAWDLDRIKVPAAGQTVWQIPTIKGLITEQRFPGVIVYSRRLRSYWKDLYSGGQNPPDCASMDCIVGVPSKTGVLPGGECQKCAFAKFGSAVDQFGKPAAGQACKELRQLFVLTPYSKMPMMMVIPPTSLKPVKKYFYMLLGNEIHYQNALTIFSLGVTKTGKGIPYSTVKLDCGGEVTGEQAAMANQWKQMLTGLVQTITLDSSDYESVQQEENF